MAGGQVPAISVCQEAGVVVRQCAARVGAVDTWRFHPLDADGNADSTFPGRNRRIAACVAAYAVVEAGFAVRGRFHESP